MNLSTLVCVLISVFGVVAVAYVIMIGERSVSQMEYDYRNACIASGGSYIPTGDGNMCLRAGVASTPPLKTE